MNVDLDCGPRAHLDLLLVVAVVVVVGLGHVVVDGHQEEAVVLLAPCWRAAAADSSGAGSVTVGSYHSFWRVWELEIIRH